MVTLSSCGIIICKKTFSELKQNPGSINIKNQVFYGLVSLQKYRKKVNILRKLHIKELNLFCCRIIKI